MLAACIVVINADGEVDKVHSLPGLDFLLNFQHYSGYLESIDGTYVFYWLFESKSNVAKDPLLVWLNGGPGASSLMGALTENGPLRMNDDGEHIETNEYAWNANATMLYLESPASVGFSYNINGTVKAGDNYTAEVNYAALADFYKKYPRYRLNDLYITGESYGGIYVPTFSALVNRRKLVKNFKGFVIGNGLLDWTLNENSFYPFANYHGYIDEYDWSNLMKECCVGVNNLRDCDFNGNNKVGCEFARLSSKRLSFLSNLNPYNIYGDCWQDKNASLDIVYENGIPLVQEYIHRKMMPSAVKQEDSSGSPRPLIPCTNHAKLRHYLAREDVKKALHIRPQSLAWQEISSKVFAVHSHDYTGMQSFFKEMLADGIRALVYNGDIDAVCNFIMGKWFVEDLQQQVDKPFAAWLVDNQVAGMVKVYGPQHQQQLVFTTIRGAGHMVPTDKPKVALEMLHKFINKQF